MIVCITASGKVSPQLIQDLIEDMFMPYAGQELTLDEEELDLLRQIAVAEIPVFDLARALFSYMPLHGAESNGDETEASSEKNPTGEGDSDRSVDLSDLGLTAEQLEEIDNRLMRHDIRVRENLHPTRYTNGTREIPAPMKETVSTVEGAKYFKSKTGKLRKAGPRSKLRPGEIEVVLTDKEIEEANV